MDNVGNSPPLDSLKGQKSEYYRNQKKLIVKAQVTVHLWSVDQGVARSVIFIFYFKLCTNYIHRLKKSCLKKYGTKRNRKERHAASCEKETKTRQNFFCLKMMHENPPAAPFYSVQISYFFR